MTPFIPILTLSPSGWWFTDQAVSYHIPANVAALWFTQTLTANFQVYV